MRRRLYKVTNLFLVLVILLGTPGIFGSSAAAAPPTAHNTVVIMVDDLPWYMMDYLPQTKMLLQDVRGISFTNNFVSTATCCPSRTSFLSGLLPNHTQVLNNQAPFGGVTRFDDTKTFVNNLHTAGYKTGLFGKYLNEMRQMKPYPYVPPGWDDFNAMLFNGSATNGFYNYDLIENGTVKHYGTNPEDYSTNVLLNKTMSFIDNNAGVNPFFAYYAPFAPHKPAVPAPGDEHVFDSLVVPRAANFNEQDVSDKPRWIRDIAPLSQAKIDELDQLYRDMAGTLLSVDRAVAQIVQKLKDKNILSQTMIVFVSDNGLSLGSHRWDLKESSHDETIKVPLIIRKPGATVSGTQDDLVMNVDLAPTILSWMAVNRTWEMDGKSLLNYFHHTDAKSIRDVAQIQVLGRPFNNNANFIGLRTKDYMYARYRNGDEEFYDLNIDPLEMINRLNDVDYQTTVMLLRAQLDSMKEPTDLSVTSTIGPATVAPNGTVTADVQITNTGAVMASNVYLRYTIPTKFNQQVCSASNDGKCYSFGNNREVRYMAIDPGQTVTAHLTFKVKSAATPGQQSINFSVDHFNTVDTVSDNNTVSVSVIVLPL